MATRHSASKKIRNTGYKKQYSILRSHIRNISGNKTTVVPT